MSGVLCFHPFRVLENALFSFVFRCQERETRRSKFSAAALPPTDPPYHIVLSAYILHTLARLCFARRGLVWVCADVWRDRSADRSKCTFIHAAWKWMWAAEKNLLRLPMKRSRRREKTISYPLEPPLNTTKKQKKHNWYRFIKYRFAGENLALRPFKYHRRLNKTGPEFVWRLYFPSFIQPWLIISRLHSQFPRICRNK